MMRIESKEIPGQVTLKLEGRLTGAWVATLEESWQAARSRHPREEFALDLTGVTLVDKSGWYLLRLMHHDGVSFVASGLMNDEIEARVTSK